MIWATNLPLAAHFSVQGELLVPHAGPLGWQGHLWEFVVRLYVLAAGVGWQGGSITSPGTRM